MAADHTPEFPNLAALGAYLADNHWRKCKTHVPNFPPEELEHWYLFLPDIEPRREGSEQPIQVCLAAWSPAHREYTQITLEIREEKQDREWMTIEIYGLSLNTLTAETLATQIRSLCAAWTAANLKS